MPDCRLKITNDITDNIYSIIGIGRTSATPINHNKILLPIGGKDNDNKSLKSKNNTYYWAQRIQNIVNTKYNSEQFGNLISIDNTSSDKGTIIDITIPKKLIDGFEVKFGDKTYEKFTKEHSTRMDEGNQRITDEGDVLPNLFGLDETKDLEFHINTINVVSNFLENAGIETRLVPQFLTEKGTVVEGAIAAANFINKTVDILDDIEKRPAAWNKLPEEAAHFWYRLLDNNSPLKDLLLQSAKTTHKEEQLRNSLYNKTYDGPKILGQLAKDAQGNITTKAALSPIREEAIGQLIAEAIKRIETKKGSPADYSFFKKFLEWLNRLLGDYGHIYEPTKRISEKDPFEIAAIKILSSDMSDLMTWKEYSRLNKVIYFDSELTEQSIQEKKELQEVKDNEEFFNYLINKKYKKKVRYLNKTLDKYFYISDTAKATQGLRGFEIQLNKDIDFIKNLNEHEKKILESTNNYTNVNPSLKGLPNILTKYKNNKIALGQEFKLDGVKKPELQIYNAVLSLIKRENPDIKSISAEQFTNEIYNYLKVNYLLGFADEQNYLTYRIRDTFNNLGFYNDVNDYPTLDEDMYDIRDLSLDEEQAQIETNTGKKEDYSPIKHRKISLRFNDTYFKRSTHFNMSPSAWGNLTYFPSAPNGPKNAVLLHEIQNDNIEFIENLDKDYGKTINEELNTYLIGLTNRYRDSILAIKHGNKKIEYIQPSGFQNYFDRILMTILQKSTEYIQRGSTFIDLHGEYNMLKEHAQEKISLFESDNYKKVDAQKKVDKLYSERGILTQFIARGGIKSLLAEEEIGMLDYRLKAINSGTQIEYFPDENQHEEAAIGIKEKMRRAQDLFSSLNLNKRFAALYSEGTMVPFIKIIPTVKPRTNKQVLNTNINSTILLSEKMMLNNINKQIILAKQEVLGKIKQENSYIFATKVIKLNYSQFERIVGNVAYNAKLLNAKVQDRAQTKLGTQNENDLSIDSKLMSQEEIYKGLQEEAYKKSEEVGSSLEESREGIKKRTALELAYFSPLIHHLIQTHIKEKGKDVPMYFSGYEITMLTQNNTSTAKIYAGPEEVKKGLTYAVGPLWTAMNGISGIKLEYIDNIPGFVKPTGGYKVNLDNYSYESPILYGLETNKKEFISSTVSKKNEKLDILLKEYLTINGIELEYLSTLLDKFGGDYTAAYFRGIKEVISINSRLEKKDTLAEEVAHSLVEGLGDDNFLVKKAMNLLSRTDYKTKLDPQYIKLYKNNEKALQKEYLGKLIADVLTHKFEPTTQTELSLLETILKLIDKFISLFKTSDRTAQIDSIVEELATKIINKDKIIQTSSAQPYNTTYFQVNNTSKLDPKFKKETIYFKRRLQEIKVTLQKETISDARIVELTEEQDKIKKSLEELSISNNKQILIDLATELLNNLETRFIEKLEGNKLDINKMHADDVTYAVDTLDAFKDLVGTSDKAKSLYERLEPFIGDFAINQVNKYASEEKELTKADIESQTTDINRLIGSFGALADLGNYLARTIGAIIKEAQNKISTTNKKVADAIKKEVDLLRDYNKSIGVAEKDMYNVFTQVYKGTTVLTRQYNTEFYDLLYMKDVDKRKVWRKANALFNPETETWSPRTNKFNNPNYITIQKTPALKKFYKFHKDLIAGAAKKLPVKLGENFIANIKKNTLQDIISSDASKLGKLKDAISNITDINSQEFNNEDFIGDEELFQDVVPLKFIARVKAEDKSKDLGENLLTFVSFANSYEEMSNVLPKTRLLQEEIKKKHYIKSNNPKVKIIGEESNIFKMTDDYIRMQVKGEMKKDEMKIRIKTLYDENGNKIGEKFIHGSDIVDFGLKYNSLLRIGLNPFNGITNVFIGDIGNIIEAFGARFYGIKDLKNATNIFFKQNFNEESELYKWLEKLNPLQELEDYQNIDKVSLSKGLTADKIKSFLYSPQRIGEKFLQTRTMLAMLIKNGYITPEGITTEKGQSLTEEQLSRFSDKIQRVNQMIHGRYSARDAATVQQSVLWRMAIQFKKWIPAAIESRVQGKHFDNRLGVEVEGRYRTYIKGFNLMVAKLKNDHEKLKKNEFTELDKYNMRKNLTELVILAGTLLMYAGLGWDDDKERKKNPYFKFAMNQLDRVSGDMLFFYNPAEANRTLKSPFALVKTTGDLVDVFMSIPYAFGIEGSTYTKGPKAKENRFIANLIDVLPVVKPIADVIRISKKQPYIEPVKSN